MTDDPLARRIARQLDASLERLDPDIARGLAAARAAAVGRIRQSSLAHGAAWWMTGGAVQGALGRPHGARRYWLPALVLAIAVAALLTWRALEPARDDDIALLADELPLNAYLDKGFDAWLDSSRQ
jgi:hypothetical protein